MKLKTNLNKLLAIAAVTAVASFSVTAFAAMGESDVEPYLKSQGCLKCHSIEKEKKGPSFKKTAAKYKGKPEGESAVIKNITTGPMAKFDDGSEEEHKIIETKDAADLKTISKWILSR
ncbi:MAG: cytochrome C [Polaromonas sp.]|nr:cytochrome C [Polaromonas sp.]